MKSLFPYLKPFKRQCIIGPFCKWMEAMLELLLPTIMAYMINHGVLLHDQTIVLLYGGLMILMVVTGFGFSLICQYQAAVASQGFGTNMRNLLFTRILSFSYEDLDRFGEATLINRIGNDINQLQIAVAMMIRLVVRSPFIIIGAMIMAMLLDFHLSLILLATVPLIAVTLFAFIRLTTPLYTAYQKKLDIFLNVLNENLSGVRVIRAFLAQRSERKRLDDASADLQTQMMKVARLSALLNPISALIVNGAIVILLWNGILSLPEAIPAGTLVAFINYATQILLACVAVSNLIVIFTKAAASANRVNEILAIPCAPEKGTETTILDPATALVFDHVNFTYPLGQKPAISDLSFFVPTGETIGIIGGTGSGKSTIASVLMRFYDSSHITLFGRPLSSYSEATFDALVTLIPQETELFSGTLRENLYAGKRTATDEELEEALRKAQAYDFVMEKTAGLDMRIEAQGKNLSGGQKQRIAIARGLLRKSQILIFDDSFSALDYQTDATLRSELAQMDQQTKLIISQRVATLLGCDRILVLDNGTAASYGSHEYLYEHCAIYREICASQAITKEVRA